MLPFKVLLKYVLPFKFVLPSVVQDDNDAASDCDMFASSDASIFSNMSLLSVDSCHSGPLPGTHKKPHWEVRGLGVHRACLCVSLCVSRPSVTWVCTVPAYVYRFVCRVCL